MAEKIRLQLTYLYGGAVQYQAGEHLGPRVLPDHEFVLILEGNVTYQVQRREYAAPPGSIILARPGLQEAYTWDKRGRTRHAFFHFALDQVPAEWPEPSLWPVIRTQPDPVLPALFRHVMRRIYQHPNWPACKPGDDDCQVVETLMRLFLEESITAESEFEHGRPAPVSRAIRHMREVIDEAPHRTLSLPQLSRVAGVNAKHLCRLFRHTLGHPPIETHRLLRLQLALALLTRSNLTVKQIAHRCGFDDPAYFSRCFMKVFRRSPRAVRKRLADGLPPPPNPLPVDVTPRLSW